MRPKMYRPIINRFLLVAFVALYIVAVCNNLFWTKFWDYSQQDISFAIITGLFLFSVLCAFIGSFSYKYLLKPIAVLLVIIAGSTSYFSDTFGTIIDSNMIENVLATEQSEARELITAGLVWHLILYTVLPVFLLLWTRINFGTFKKIYFQNVAFVTVAILFATLIFWSSFSSFVSIARNHRDLQMSLIPTQPLFALSQYVARNFAVKEKSFVQIGLDATLVSKPPLGQKRKPKLTIMVLGETARAKSFSINGYERDTNPELKKLKLFNFENVKSCGTATAVSVPCMFSQFTKSNYSSAKAKYSENVLDVINRAGVHTVWINNNSGSKGQANRIIYVDLRENTVSKHCINGRCFDEVLVDEMVKYVNGQDVKDTLIILHPLGSHGPSYYKRVPQPIKKFFPECEIDELNKCTQQEVINGYDNTIVYTDHFLGKIVRYLKTKETSYDTTMVYLSDHGESTGEFGLYLHGLPYAFAPDEQIHVPFVVWMSKAMIQQKKIDLECMQRVVKKPISHDNFFHTLLQLVDVSTSVYDSKLDVFHQCQN